MAYAKIKQVAHYVPEQVISNEDLSKIMETGDEWISTRTGIKRRHISTSETSSDLAGEVAKQLLRKSSTAADEVDFIVVATVTPDSTMPSTAAIVQSKIGARNAFAFDQTAACSGFVFALATAEKFISSGAYQRGIVIGSETLSKIIDWSDRRTAVLFGDGAGGVLLEASEEKCFLAETLSTDGNRGQYLTSNYVGLSSPFSEMSVDRKFLYMNGRAIFDFVIRDVTASIKTILEDTRMLLTDIDYFLLHQANIRILETIARKIGAPMEKFPANIVEYGNTSAASIPILLSECIDDGLIRFDGSQRILMSGFGGGLTWGTLIVKI